MKIAPAKRALLFYEERPVPVKTSIVSSADDPWSNRLRISAFLYPVGLAVASEICVLVGVGLELS